MSPSVHDWAGLLDDAALFPPGDAPMASAVPRHRTHRRGPHDAMVGPFLVPAARLGELLGALPDDGAALDLGVIGTIEALPAALDTVAGDPRVVLRSVEVAPSDAPGVPQVPPGVVVSVEVPRDDRRPEFLDALVGTTARAKLRTGGLAAAAFPRADELAEALVGCHERGVAVKATAGLHRAVHHTDPTTGFVHHGYLNLLLAADTAVRGGDVDAVTAALTTTEGVGGAVAALGAGTARWHAARRLFTSFGTCSIDEPVADLEALGLLDTDLLEASR